MKHILDEYLFPFVCIMVMLMAYGFFMKMVEYTHEEKMAVNAAVQACLDDKDVCLEIIDKMSKNPPPR